MYVHKNGLKKSERLHVRTTPELKKRFEEKIKSVNFYLVEDQSMDMSGWINLLVDFFITGCDRFKEKIEANGIDADGFRQEYAHLLSLEQFLLLYWDFHKNALDRFMKSELIDAISIGEEKAEKMNKFVALVEKLKNKREGHEAKD